MSKRNIVVILCDQLRPDFLEVYGCEAIPTPNINRLAEMGVVFDHAITQSTVCAPARASMMTGRYVSDHGVWTNDVPFRDGVEYLAERMNELGYNTAAFGKLHHYPADDAKGFQHVRFMEEGRLKDRDDYFRWLKDMHPEVERIFNYDDYTFKFYEDEYYEHWIATEAINYIDNHINENKETPFLAWISFQGPHTPLDPPKEVKGTVKKEKLPYPIERLEEDIPPVTRYRGVLAGSSDSIDVIMEQRAAYGEMIVEIDRQIGRILSKLESMGILDNTTVIFSADHGDLLGDFGLIAKGPFPYQGQLAIPLIVSNHPDIVPGTRSHSLVGNIDIPGTVLDIAGADRGIGVSRSLLDQASECPKHPREVNFSEFCDSIKTVENKKYRYSYYPFTGYAELYDRENDPKEQINLAGRQEYDRVEKEFLKQIIDFMIISKGIRVEAHDFVPEQQEGVRKKYPEFENEFKVAFPIANKKEIEKLREAGLSFDYNEFCKGKKILAHYGVYYEEKGLSSENIPE